MLLVVVKALIDKETTAKSRFFSVLCILAALKQSLFFLCLPSLNFLGMSVQSEVL